MIPRLVLLAVLAATACAHTPAGLADAPAASLQTAQDVSWWEERVRPDRLHLLAALLAGAVQEAEKCRAEPSAECKKVSGRYSLRQEEGERVSMRLRRWQYEEVRVHGRADVDTDRFSLDLRLEIRDRDDDGPKWWAVQVQGTQDAAGHWRAEGDLAAEGHGRVQMLAEGVTLSKACKSEPMDGTMRFRSGATEAVVRYDGATQCDETGIATWTRDGQPQGEVDVVGTLRCGVAPGRPGAPVGWLVWIALAVRRRQRRARGGRDLFSPR